MANHLEEVGDCHHRAVKVLEHGVWPLFDCFLGIDPSRLLDWLGVALSLTVLVDGDGGSVGHLSAIGLVVVLLSLHFQIFGEMLSFVFRGDVGRIEARG